MKNQQSFIVHQKYFLSPLNYKSLVPPKNHCFVPSNSKSLFCPLKSVYGHFKIIVLSPQIWQICENLKFEPNSTDFEWWFRVESGVISKTVDKKRDLRTFCRWSNLSRFTRFWGDQSDHKFAVGGPQLILRAGHWRILSRLHRVPYFCSKIMTPCIVVT